MKSEIFSNLFKRGDKEGKRYFIECWCYDPSHLLVFDFINEDDFKEISVFITYNYKSPWYKRILYAIKGQPDFMNNIGITSENIHQLEEVIKEIKKFYNYK